MKTAFKLICFVAFMLLVAVSGCSRGQGGKAKMSKEMKAKLEVVLQQMLSRTTNEDDQAALKSAEPFHKIEAAPVDMIGFSVPIKPGTNRVHLSFTVNHFLKTSPEVLATQALEDMQFAKTALQVRKN